QKQRFPRGGGSALCRMPFRAGRCRARDETPHHTEESMRIHRFAAKTLAAFAVTFALASLAPSAFAADWSCWPFTLHKQQCDPSCPARAPAPLRKPEVKPEEKKVPPEKMVEPEKKDNLIAPPLVEAAPETGPALGAAGFSLASSNVGYIDPAIPF